RVPDAPRGKTAGRGYSHKLPASRSESGTVKHVAAAELAARATEPAAARGRRGWRTDLRRGHPVAVAAGPDMAARAADRESRCDGIAGQTGARAASGYLLCAGDRAGAAVACGDLAGGSRDGSGQPPAACAG